MAGARITDFSATTDTVQFREGMGQRYILTVDAEEEFDWGKPIKRSGHTLHSIARLAKFQQFCEGQGVCPVYLVDYPIATSPAVADILRPAIAAGKAEIGVQLHPWVNPPHHEEVSEFNTFAGNLPIEVERDKFRRLREAIEKAFEARPLIYRAGRYGVGPNTAGILRENGISIDTSVRSYFDYSSAGGPNFRDFPITPWWIDRPGRLMELPLTTVYCGALRKLGRRLYPLLWRMPQVRGALARLGLLERIALTPEGITLKEAMRGVDIAIEEGVPILVFSFHSPSLAPGFTPYVRDEDDLDAFYAWWRQIFAELASRGIAPIKVSEVIDAALA